MQYTDFGLPDPWLNWGQNNTNAQVPDWGSDNNGGYTGNFNDPGVEPIDWLSSVWKKLEVLDPCVSQNDCCAVYGVGC